MKYTEFRELIRKRLIRSPSGMTWKELKKALDLPYDRPCPEWIAQMELDIGLQRQEKKGNALIWRLKHVGRSAVPSFQPSSEQALRATSK